MAFEAKRYLTPALALVAILAACGNTGRTKADGGDTVDDLAILPPDFTPDPNLGPVDLKMARNPDAACSNASAKGMPAKLPVDIILIVDNSGSMRNKIRGVELNINQNLTQLLEKNGLDYRVIVISSYGDWTNNMICPSKPLSGNDCVYPVKGPPKLTQRYFHYDYNIQSNDSYQRALESYRKEDIWHLAPQGWSQWLRAGAVKMFIELTDDNSTMPASQFDFMLRAMDPQQFGTDKKRNFVFHAIVGMKGNDLNVNLPWGPKDPVQMVKCGMDAENASIEHQNMAIITGGLRFPICAWANFDGIFQVITQGVVDGSTLSCEILMPTPPNDDKGEPQMIDFETVGVQYVSPLTFNLPVDFKLVASPALCGPDSFYLSPNKDRILLCPTTCTRIQADKKAEITVLYDCLYIGG